MQKKLLTGVIIIIFVLVILPIGWYYWKINQPPQPHGDDLTDINIYINEKFDYSVEYSENWHIGFYGESKEQAEVVFFVSDRKDLQAADGGLPLGVKAEIIVQNLEELKEIDESMSYIKTITEYIEWQNMNQAGFDVEMQGKCIEENIKIDGLDAVKKVCDNPTEESFGKVSKIQFLNPDGNHAFLIQYLGREPYYSDNKTEFDYIYQSFKF